MRPVPLEQILNKGELELVEAIYAEPGYVVLKSEEAHVVKLLDLGLIEPVQSGSYKYVCTDNVYE